MVHQEMSIPSVPFSSSRRVESAVELANILAGDLEPEIKNLYYYHNTKPIYGLHVQETINCLTLLLSI